MAKHITWRGSKIDTCKSIPRDCSQLDPTIVQSADKTIQLIVAAGYQGVRIDKSLDATSGKPMASIFYDISTVEGFAVGMILDTLPTATSPFNPDEILTLISCSQLLQSLYPLELDLKTEGAK
jgi:hypothetical protein